MPDDLQQLQRKIEEGLEAVRELRKLEAEKKKAARPKLRLIRGGAVGAAVWAGVEWLWGYKAAVVLTAAAVTFTGGVLAEHPDRSGADPPEHAITAPKPRSSAPPTPPRAAPTPRRTSPPRTQVPLATPTVVPPVRPVTARPVKPTPTLLPATPSLGVTKTPVTVSPPVKPTVTPSVTPSIPVAVETADCTGIGILGLCLLGN